MKLDPAVLMQNELKSLSPTGPKKKEFRHIVPSDDEPVRGRIGANSSLRLGGIQVSEEWAIRGGPLIALDRLRALEAASGSTKVRLPSE